MTLMILSVFTLSGCQVPYLAKNAYGQLRLMNARIPIEEALNDSTLNTEEKNKLKLVQEVRKFTAEDLKLNIKENYSSFVKLNQPYVTYVVSAAPRWKLEHYQWYFPIIGHVPYKGYFDEPSAKNLELELKNQGMDTYLRGVAAFSTLGWFKDPIYSSMLRYKEHDLVNTIIHESVHASIFIKSSADFNEQLAVFLAGKGTERFYKQKEGKNSATLKLIQNENYDDAIFSLFISKEVKALSDWYNQIAKDPKISEQDKEAWRQEKFSKIKENFQKDIEPKLLTNSLKYFTRIELNNARLLLFKTYMDDLNDFEALYEKTDRNWETFLACINLLKKDSHPDQSLKQMIKNEDRSCSLKLTKPI